MNDLLEAHERVQLADRERSAAAEARRAAIRQAREQGMTLHAIGDVLGITRVRVAQILNGS